MARFGDVVVVGSLPEVEVGAAVAAVNAGGLEGHDGDGGGGSVVEAVVVGEESQGEEAALVGWEGAGGDGAGMGVLAKELDWGSGVGGQRGWGWGEGEGHRESEWGGGWRVG